MKLSASLVCIVMGVIGGILFSGVLASIEVEQEEAYGDIFITMTSDYNRYSQSARTVLIITDEDGNPAMPEGDIAVRVTSMKPQNTAYYQYGLNEDFTYTITEYDYFSWNTISGRTTGLILESPMVLKEGSYKVEVFMNFDRYGKLYMTNGFEVWE